MLLSLTLALSLNVTSPQTYDDLVFIAESIYRDEWCGTRYTASGSYARAIDGVTKRENLTRDQLRDYVGVTLDSVIYYYGSFPLEACR